MRIEQLTFTRFIAAISIVIFHYGEGVSLFYNDYTSFLFKQAHLGVSYFFVLSGFVMIIAYGNCNHITFIEYIKNRVIRIYPAYLLAIFLILLTNAFQDINKLDLILNITMLQSWLPKKALTLNYPGWSLSVELFFYISFPILFNHFYSKKNLKTLTIYIVSFFIFSQIIFYLITNGSIQLSYYSIKDIWYHPLFHFNEFIIGNLAGIYFNKYLKKKKGGYILPILLIILFLIILFKYPFGLNYHNGLLSILFVPLIILTSLSNNKLIKLISKKYFIFLGHISFGIYVYQVPLWLFFSDYRMNKYLGFNKETEQTSLFFIRLIILITFSALSYLYFEKPLSIRMKKTLTRL